MAVCLIGLGTNVGDRQAMLDRALAALATLAGTTVIARSGFHLTRPVGGPAGQGEFLNAAALVETSLAPLDLLDQMQRIEVELGRVRGERWGPRPIDLDLLLYGERTLRSARLTLPHPRLAFRRFALAPAAEIAPDLLHPRIGWTVARLLAHLDESMPYLALAAIPGAGKSRLAERIAETFSGAVLHDPCGGDDRLVSGAHAASPSAARELEFVEARRRVLERTGWARSDRLVVSDFWFGQSLAYASCQLAGDELERFRAAWQRNAEAVIAPRLTVLIDAGGADEPLAELRVALASELDRPGHGPVLFVERATAEDQLDEVVAAVEAMQ